MNTLTIFFDWLLTASFRASVLVLVVLAIQWAFRKQLAARARYALWLPVLIVLLTPVLPQSRWSIENVFKASEKTVSIPLIVQTAPTTVSAPITENITLVSKPLDWSKIGLTAWIGIAAAFLLIAGFSFFRTLRRFHRSRLPLSAEWTTQIAQLAREIGLPRAPRVWISSAVTSPAVTGVLRPVLLLPAGFEQDFTPGEARLILQHELTHLKRHDLPLNALLCVMMALHWFNPLLWLAFLKVRADREAACDAQVLENATPQRRSAYGHALLKIESAFAPLRLSLGFIGILQRHASLRARIRSIAAPTRTRPLTGLLVTACMLAMTFLGVTRAEKPAPADPPAKLMTLQIRVIDFKQASDWNIGGRLAPLAADEQADLKMESLSQQDLEKLLAETNRQRGAHVTAYPRMTVRAGEKASIRSVVNQPIASDKKNKEGKPAIDYLPIGFIGNFVVKPLADSKVSLDIDITNSQIIGERQVAGNPYPIVNSLVYNAPTELAAGMSAIVYGWQEEWENGKRQKPRPVLFVLTPGVVAAEPSEPEKKAPASTAASSESVFDEKQDTAEVQTARPPAARPQKYDIRKAPLGDVIRSLATDAGLKFISLPEDHPSSRKLVTFNVEDSPLSVLETLCKAHGLVLVFDSNLWYIRAADDPELIGRSYPYLKSSVKPADVLSDLQTLVKAPATVRFDETNGAFYINATRLQHTWAEGYFRGLYGKR